MSPFKAGVLIFFGVLALGAVFIFATFSGGSRSNVGTVVMWGVLDEEIVGDVLSDLRIRDSSYRDVSYIQIPENSFSETLTEAIAAGTGPDLIFLANDELLREQDKLIPISFRSYSRRDFQDTFVEAGEVYLTDESVLGLPFYIDPMVLFWNRTLFSEAGIARAPKYWDEFVDIAPTLTNAAENGTITQSAVALGEWENVVSAKDIFVSLIVGLGNAVTSFNEDGELVSILTDRGDAPVPPAESALRFYTDFADPVKSVYSWNRSLPNSQAAFLAGQLGVYLGNASETFSLRSANPNLNFDVSAYPEVRDGRVAVPAHVFALSVPRGSTNPTGALQTAIALTSNASQEILVGLTGLPSVRRDVLSVSPNNQYETIFRNAALNAYSFRDPDADATERIFKRMVEDVASGRERLPEAVRNGHGELRALSGVQ